MKFLERKADMLKNTSQETIVLKWSGVEISLNPGDQCDVSSSFGARDNVILALEDRFMGKFGGKIMKFTPQPKKEEITPVIEDLKAEPPLVEAKGKRGRPKGR